MKMQLDIVSSDDISLTDELKHVFQDIRNMLSEIESKRAKPEKLKITSILEAIKKLLSTDTESSYGKLIKRLSTTIEEISNDSNYPARQVTGLNQEVTSIEKDLALELHRRGISHCHGIVPVVTEVVLCDENYLFV